MLPSDGSLKSVVPPRGGPSLKRPGPPPPPAPLLSPPRLLPPPRFRIPKSSSLKPAETDRWTGGQTDRQVSPQTDALRCPAPSGTCKVTNEHEMVEVKGMMGKKSKQGVVQQLQGVERVVESVIWSLRVA